MVSGANEITLDNKRRKRKRKIRFAIRRGNGLAILHPDQFILIWRRRMGRLIGRRIWTWRIEALAMLGGEYRNAVHVSSRLSFGVPPVAALPDHAG